MEDPSRLVPEIVRAYAEWAGRRVPTAPSDTPVAKTGVRTRREPFEIDCHIRHAPGDVRAVKARGLAEYDEAGAFVRVVDVAISEITEQIAAEPPQPSTADLARANELLHAEIQKRQQAEEGRLQLLNRLVYAEEEERRRIAREMHDQCGQDLTALKMQTERLRDHCGGTLRGEVEALEVTAAHLDRDIDFLVWELRPTMLDGVDLQTALAKYVENWSAHFGIPAELHASGTFDDRMTAKVKSTLYRITQETLTNIARHAHARNVGVMLEGHCHHVSLVVEDDGVGFDADRTRIAGLGLGLLGMQERAALVAGTVEVESAPGRGTTVLVRVPTPAPHLPQV